MRIHDISLPVSESMTVWEGQPQVALTHVRHLARRDNATVGHISMTVHTGTHVDAPSHHFIDAPGADQLELATLIGPAVVVHALDAQSISANVLARLDIPPRSRRVLIRTRNSDMWRRPRAGFTRDYVGITQDGAHWLVDSGVGLVGTDYLSVVSWRDLVPAHRVLLGAGVVLLEGLDLGMVAPGAYQLVCLPLRIVDGDGSPARAVLIDEAASEVDKQLGCPRMAA